MAPRNDNSKPLSPINPTEVNDIDGGLAREQREVLLERFLEQDRLVREANERGHREAQDLMARMVANNFRFVRHPVAPAAAPAAADDTETANNTNNGTTINPANPAPHN